MSEISNIPQIQGFQLDILQNDLHIGFTGDIAKRIQKARWTDETHAMKVFPAAVDALMSAFVQAQAVEDQAYVIAQGSDLTKQRLEKDRQRDVLWKEIKKTVDTFATLTIFPDKQEAALRMQPNLTGGLSPCEHEKKRPGASSQGDSRAVLSCFSHGDMKVTSISRCVIVLTA